ncbi:hypothetical protein BJ508DRAFT_309505 [Ascobolus immersus RN42]|uniref:Uncharacterized protein n=1 Tax=Ascobolus immersus RN42 TaxID=1160509 RepID=A0A3N4I0A6_ASCIM|nr:hypothetical protein BJ508DRAFT_309505 [Ascobolus immersus RN42]
MLENNFILIPRLLRARFKSISPTSPVVYERIYENYYIGTRNNTGISWNVVRVHITKMFDAFCTKTLQACKGQAEYYTGMVGRETLATKARARVKSHVESQRIYEMVLKPSDKRSIASEIRTGPSSQSCGHKLRSRRDSEKNRMVNELIRTYKALNYEGFRIRMQLKNDYSRGCLRLARF